MAKNDDKTKPADEPVADAEKEQMRTRIAELEKENAEMKEQIENPPEDEDKKLMWQKIEELEKKNAELKAEIKKPVVNIKGFVLEADDPFAAGSMRVYVSSTKAKQTQRAILPFVLPYNDKPATKKALESYIVRADGGGDKAWTAAAREALAKL